MCPEVVYKRERVGIEKHGLVETRRERMCNNNKNSSDHPGDIVGDRPDYEFPEMNIIHLSDVIQYTVFFFFETFFLLFVKLKYFCTRV